MLPVLPPPCIPPAADSSSTPLDSGPDRGNPLNTTAILSVSNLQVRYPVSGRRMLTAIDDLSLTLHHGETLAVVGESGCGKSTLARAICGLTPISAGEIRFGGERLHGGDRRAVRRIGKHIQYVFQDPLDALDPRMTIAEILAEPLRHHFPKLTRGERQRRIDTALDAVALSPRHLTRYPHEFSGGQAQRIGIARALICDPSILICDEPVSALDVSIQAQIINLLQDVQHERRLAMLFISHDLRVVRHIADRMMVLYLGRLMEAGPAAALFDQPRHPYTRALLAAIPKADPAEEQERLEATPPLGNDLPSPLDPPSGCVFRTRCPEAAEPCKTYRHPPMELSLSHAVNCVHATTPDG